MVERISKNHIVNNLVAAYLRANPGGKREMGRRGEGEERGGEEWGRERGGRVGGRCMYLRANPVTLYLQLIQRLVCSPDKKREEEDLKELDAKNKITKDMVREDVCIHMYPQP